MKDKNDAELYERIAQRIKRRKATVRWCAFAINVISFLMYLMWLVVVIFNRNAPFAGMLSQFSFIFMMPTIFWILGLMGHLLGVLSAGGYWDERIAARSEIEERVESQIMARRLADKSKRDASRLQDQTITNGQNGELIYPDDQEALKKFIAASAPAE